MSWCSVKAFYSVMASQSKIMMTETREQKKQETHETRRSPVKQSKIQQSLIVQAFWLNVDIIFPCKEFDFPFDKKKKAELLQPKVFCDIFIKIGLKRLNKKSFQKYIYIFHFFHQNCFVSNLVEIGQVVL